MHVAHVLVWRHVPSADARNPNLALSSSSQASFLSPLPCKYRRRLDMTHLTVDLQLELCFLQTLCRSDLHRTQLQAKPPVTSLAPRCLNGPYPQPRQGTLRRNILSCALRRTLAPPGDTTCILHFHHEHLLLHDMSQLKACCYII